MSDQLPSGQFSDSQSDAELWRQFKEDDELAFGQLAQRYYKRLFGYGSKFSKDREFIKDCIQDLFLELWDRRQNLSVPDSVKLYLLISLRRKMQRKRSETRWLEDSEELTFESNLVGALPIETTIIEDEASQYYIRKLQLLIPKLSRRQQEIIYLRFYENLDNQAIAELMSLSRQGVANLLWRTLKELKDYWYVGLNGLILLALLLALEEVHQHDNESSRAWRPVATEAGSESDGRSVDQWQRDHKLSVEFLNGGQRLVEHLVFGQNI